MEAMQRNESAPPRRAWLPWGLLVGAVMLATTGAWAGTRSISALVDRNDALSQEAAESEARVAELQALRDAMSRRLRTLEQQHHAAYTAAVTATAACTTALQPPTPPTGKAEPSRRLAKAKKQGRR